ncbi:prolyl 4-hydroxylase subunit alpha-3-like [Mizuhopecten yessoensis]|uniref:prolyl 4-hydroxylase subunit alpha-3-like n=1 Tax=Mizuhopecten yessoensis TaxID=6573 RepID=UPI000B45C1A6|nr:prolyl 4-hydroxylase subunit alpha-3-like [Mizuhopecten yessoensis]
MESKIYSSTREVQLVAKEEMTLIAVLDEFVMSEQRAGRDVKQNILTFLNHVKAVRLPHCDNAEFGDNPITAFHLLKRALLWDEVVSSICCDTCMEISSVTEFSNSILELHEEGGPPVTLDDVNGTAKAILRLWKTYDLDIDKLMSGIILDTKTEPLTSSDIIDISHHAKGFQKIVWLEKLLERYNVSKDEDMLIKSMLAKEYSEYGMPWKSVEIITPFLYIDDNNIKADYHLYMSRSYRIAVHSKVLEPEVSSVRDEVYRSLCRGELRTAQEMSLLRCYLRPTRIPYYWSKEEVMYNIPRLTLFHDVLFDSEIQFIRTAAGKIMERSTVLTKNESAVSENRVSFTGWLFDAAKGNERLLKLNRRIGLVTGLDTTFRLQNTSIEQYQIANYGIGGMYAPHYDNLNIPIWKPSTVISSDDCRYSGERIATWMFYISSVKAGGATVFPKLRARVPVVKGSAAFWYNVLPNGDKDERMLHAGCPVLLGSKWVANKWIRQEGQVLTKLCGKTREAEFEYDID